MPTDNTNMDKTNTPKANIFDLSLSELADWFVERGEKSFRAKQILKWVYLHQADSFEEMTDVRTDLRSTLADFFTISRLPVKNIQTSADGSQKYVLELRDGQIIESVLMPEKDHSTLCVSTQIGCAMACRFCRTAALGFRRNLTAGEIIAQVRDAKQLAPPSLPLTNVVFMGMGEPLANIDNVLLAIKAMTRFDSGLKISHNRITVSTAGLASQMAKLGEATNVNLAVSLNATTNDLRNKLMPINHTYPIEELLHACQTYPITKKRRITFEYILLKGINDSEKDALALTRMLHPKRAKINVIPFNEHPESAFESPPEETIDRFLNVLVKHHFTVMVRRSKGRDINAACGQLAGNYISSQ